MESDTVSRKRKRSPSPAISPEPYIVPHTPLLQNISAPTPSSSLSAPIHPTSSPSPSIASPPPTPPPTPATPPVVNS